MCVVRWQNNYGGSFRVTCGVRQGGVLFLYLFALHMDDLIDSIRLSAYGLYVSQLFIGRLLYADDIVLLSPSCFGLRHLVSWGEHFGRYWDIKLSFLESQLMTFGGSNPNVNININTSTIRSVNKLKYLGVYFLSSTGKTDLTDTMRWFYGQFNNIIKQELTRDECCIVTKIYCLPTLTYGLENAVLAENTKRLMPYETIIFAIFFVAVGVRVYGLFSIL